ncbi:MAG: zf-TFIIB domain-containing protein [Acidovorax sp.]|uniref:zf-TFIIB domain-containing protein n=1 Tax=Acidovorax sp. TaxID=1872122 RepID=UPI0025C0FE7C|nr:zf-TFIIB domain-containing protein [Acidovorax sp.]MCE1191965.1 zf-TFIIB domain-containing protein [Acidovorax sp.]
MPALPSCPSCRQPMQVHRFASNMGPELELDICFACQGLWFDRHENLKLSPRAVVELFRLLHEHRADQHHPLPERMACPRCDTSLARGFDVVRSGRYMVYRCARQHGRFSTFSSFMVEKGFVRHMTRPEIDDLAKRVGAIYCTSCGAPVDIRKDHACPYCRAAFSLIDPDAVVRAMEGYAQAGARARLAGAAAPPVDIGDALVALERDHARAERERQQRAFSSASSADDVSFTGDLLAAGVALVWALVKD